MVRKALFAVLILGTLLSAGCGGGSKKKEKTLSERQAIAMGMSNPDTRATELAKLADLQFKAGEHNGARSSLGAAQMAVGEIEDNGAKAATGITVATALAKHGMTMEAKKVLKDVRTAIEADPDPATRASALGRMALVYGTALENETAAEVYLGEAASLIDEIPKTIDQVNALLEIGTSFHQIGQVEAAEARFTTAVNLASAAATPRDQADLLASIANRLQSLELTDQAQTIRASAKEIAQTIGDDFSRGYALVNVAASYKQAGDSGTAKALLVEAEKAADKVADRGLQGELRSTINRGR